MSCCWVERCVDAEVCGGGFDMGRGGDGSDIFYGLPAIEWARGYIEIRKDCVKIELSHMGRLGFG